MNQGCEAVHALGRLISGRKSNHIASNNRPSFSECVLLPWRLVFMTVEKKKPWVGLLRHDRNLSEKYIEVIDSFQQESMEMLKKTQSKSSQVVLDKCAEKRAQFKPLSNPKKEAIKNIDMWEKSGRIQKSNKMKARSPKGKNLLVPEPRVRNCLVLLVKMLTKHVII